MKIKEGAILAGLDLRMRPALIAAEEVYKKHGRKEAVITAGLDGTHSAGSLHYYGLAIDLRISHEVAFSEEEVKQVVADLQAALGMSFDVIPHATHIHVEYDA